MGGRRSGVVRRMVGDGRGTGRGQASSYSTGERGSEEHREFCCRGDSGGSGTLGSRDSQCRNPADRAESASGDLWV